MEKEKLRERRLSGKCPSKNVPPKPENTKFEDIYQVIELGVRKSE